ncbi:MAG TPA: c-type cytochrome domain-containing protein, partial [Chryseolinea sp.]|nr:c-type cytochrome domain-containing protein [Chryseolinea sp.]
MKLLNHSKTIIAITTCVVVVGACFTFQQDEIVDYSIDVKPIINSKCITCHGGVKAKSKFSLLFREDAMGKTESGKPAI